ncbi:hypothetical protein Fcan01_14988 [Folsomia candida]|uniref:Tc1-like transposase DDE domain-containing protein n=1 Tax=Folsomia candida TaxID=158441 RepID=A0A226DZ63_FOLCA|nr:hypothetical protein Fcan01_14988 [Folsomia candida]
MDFKLLATMIVAKKMIGFVGVGHRHLLRFNSNKNRVELNSQFLQGSKKPQLLHNQKPSRAKRTTITSGTRKIIRNVYNYLKTSDEHGPDENHQLAFLSNGKRNIPGIAASMLGIHENSVRGCIKKQPNLNTPPRKKRKTKWEIDDFDQTGIRNLVYRNFEQGAHITLQTLLNEINEKIDTFIESPIKISILRIIMHQIGFEYKMIDHRLRLMERQDIVEQRKKYLKRKKEIDATNKNVVFLDETWVNKNHQKQKVWTDGTVKSRPNCKIGKGDRLIITHAGSKDGFVPNVLNIFWSNTGQADYHQDMNAEYFEKWFVEQLLVSLEEPSVIIIDNAKYHSRRLDAVPTSSSRKGVIIEWLTSKKIKFPQNATKVQLYDIVKAFKPFNVEY